MATTQYKYLQPEDRVTIASLKQQGQDVRAIACRLGRPASTVSRELRRHAVAGVGYASMPAQKAPRARRAAAWRWPEPHPGGRCWMVVSTWLSWRWSSQQIAVPLRRVWPDDSSMHVSHETIYTVVYAHAGGELRRQPIACLRQGKSTRRPHSGRQDRQGRIPEMVSIHVRPPEADDRVMPGHREGDLIRGAANRSAVGVLAQRTTRLVLLAKMDDATAKSALQAFSAKLNAVAAPLRQTLACDQAASWRASGRSPSARA